MPTKRLPAAADISHLKHQAKDLLSDFRAHKLSAFQRIREFSPKHAGQPDALLAAQTFTLSDAFWTIAREYGYASWPRLKQVVAEQCGQDGTLIHNERIEDHALRQALDFLDEGNVAFLKQHLADHPGLVHQKVRFEGDNYFTEPTLIEFIAENPIRQGKLPGNITEIAKVILQAGARENQTSLNETLMLVASGRVAREAGAQIPLIDLLCDDGADPAPALIPALAHGEFDAAQQLLKHGAPLTLPAAAALGKADEVQQLLKAASVDDLQFALSLAALHNRAEVVRSLLSAGVDPNRYNPPGAHSHCTPLHSAAFAGHLETAKALIEGGARTDIGDIHHNATALDWADHAGQDAVATYLRALT